MAALTVWYWFHTDPKRRHQAASTSVDHTEIIEVRPADGDVQDRQDGEADRAVAACAEGAEPDEPGDRIDARDDRRADGAAAEEDRDDEFITGPLMARQTWDFVAAAKRAEDGGNPVVPPPPAAPRIAVPSRSGIAMAESGEADELAVVRRRREQEAARGLSDEVWDSVRRSVFDKLDG